MPFLSLSLRRELLLCARADKTTSFWNIIIQGTFHDDLTEKSADIFHFKHPKEKNSLNNRNSKLQFDEEKYFRRISYLYKSTLVLKKKLLALQFKVPVQDGSIRGECSRYILLLLLPHTFDMHYHSADIM